MVVLRLCAIAGLASASSMSSSTPSAMTPSTGSSSSASTSSAERELVVEQFEQIDQRSAQAAGLRPRPAAGCAAAAAHRANRASSARSTIVALAVLELRADADLAELADQPVILGSVGIDLALQDGVLDVLVLELSLPCIKLAQRPSDAGLLLPCLLDPCPYRRRDRRHLLVDLPLQFSNLGLDASHLREFRFQRAALLLVIRLQLGNLVPRVLDREAVIDHRQRRRRRPASTCSRSRSVASRSWMACASAVVDAARCSR